MTQPVHSHTIAAYPIKDEHGGGFRGAVLHRASRQVVRSPVMKTLQDATHWAKSHVHKHFEGDGYKLAPVRRKGEYTANVWVHPKHPNMDKPLEESTRQEFLDLIKPGDVGKSSFLRKMGQSDQPERGSKDAQKRALHQAINMRPDNPLKTSLAAFATTRSKPGARPQMHEEFRIVLEDVLEEMMSGQSYSKKKMYHKLTKGNPSVRELSNRAKKLADWHDDQAKMHWDKHESARKAHVAMMKSGKVYHPDTEKAKRIRHAVYNKIDWHDNQSNRHQIYSQWARDIAANPSKHVTNESVDISEMNDLTRKRRKIARVPDNSPYDVDDHMHGKLVKAGGKKLDTQAKLSRLLKRHQAIKRRMR